MDKNENYVSLSIYDFGNTDISSLLGVGASEIFSKGEFRLVKKAKIKVLRDTWTLESNTDNSLDFEKQVNNLLGKLDLDKLKEITSEFYSEIRCYGYVYDNSVGMHLGKHTLDMLARLNLDFDFDIYTLPAKGDNRS